MRRVSQHLETLDGIRFERTVKYQESIKGQSALDIVSVQVLDLSMLEYTPVNIGHSECEAENPLECEAENPLTLLESVFMTL